jgi:hypothetical protein
MRVKTETIYCDHEGCPCRWETKEFPWGEEIVVAAEGWVERGGHDYCPEHAR